MSPRAPPKRPRRPETSMRAPVVAHLERAGYRVWVDPDGGDYFDVVALRGEEVALIELKVEDWKGVRRQGVARRALADWIAVALPTRPRAERLRASTRGPVAPRLGIWIVGEDGVTVLREPLPLEVPDPESPAGVARARFRSLVLGAARGEVPEGVRWGSGARDSVGARRYRLDEFDG